MCNGIARPFLFFLSTFKRYRLVPNPIPGDTETQRHRDERREKREERETQRDRETERQRDRETGRREKREERREKREERHQTTRLVSFTSFAYKSVCRS